MKAVHTLPLKPEHPAKFFKLYNTYVIPDGSKLNDLLEDVLVLLDAGIDVFDSQGEELDKVPGGRAGIYALKQARAVFMQVYERAHEDERGEPGSSKEPEAS